MTSTSSEGSDQSIEETNQHSARHWSVEAKQYLSLSRAESFFSLCFFPYHMFDWPILTELFPQPKDDCGAVYVGGIYNENTIRAINDWPISTNSPFQITPGSGSSHWMFSSGPSRNNLARQLGSLICKFIRFKWNFIHKTIHDFSNDCWQN